MLKYGQLVKGKTNHNNRSFWLWQIDKELKDVFYDLASFIKLTMQAEYDDDFVAYMHDVERIMNDYSKILDQIDAWVRGKLFKKKLAVDAEEIAEVVSDLTGIPASWLCINPEKRYKTI